MFSGMLHALCGESEVIHRPQHPFHLRQRALNALLPGRIYVCGCLHVHARA